MTFLSIVNNSYRQEYYGEIRWEVQIAGGTEFIAHCMLNVMSCNRVPEKNLYINHVGRGCLERPLERRKDKVLQVGFTLS
jgi:hypothetical protein